MKQKTDLIVFPEAFVPGYPYWLTEASNLTPAQQKELYLRYASQAVVMEEGHLSGICSQLKTWKMACYLGIVERQNHSLYMSMVHINKQGVVLSVHRKLCPSYKERAVISPGDGNGLVTHKLDGFTLGGLNSDDNWMPLTRAALYAQAEDVHVACWSGNQELTSDITRVIAKESRSYVISVGAVMRPEDVDSETPYANLVKESIGNGTYHGGCCVAGPDGAWVLPLQPGVQSLRYCVLDPAFVRNLRQDFNNTRPDVTQLVVQRKRQAMAQFQE
uniref:CN hydrolase domain-containing protein n=1 Tax=Grammatophora oceanica TaxID=210454 RepID=A0A7S1UQZ5_9STRA|mmetsp:Transcript_17785/g.26317  ORF Transcript_17785/g.26317 Transcript_17785/m.26317 type:complete len:274 (+) Transcript_17785:1-822(+)